MEKKKRKAYVKYPKILTVTCAMCGTVFEVMLKDPSEFRRRYYCGDDCERKYQFAARSHAMAQRHRTSAAPIAYKEGMSRVIAERPAACSAPRRQRQDPEAIARAARDAARRARDLEYWNALRRARGITAEARLEVQP